MRLSLRQKINIGFAALLALLLAGGGLAYASAHRLIDMSARVAHTQDILTDLDGLTTQAAKAEAAERGYVLTGEAHFRPTYEGAERQILSIVDDLGSLTGSDPLQQARLALLHGFVRQKISGMHRAMALRQRGQLKAASALVHGSDQAELDARLQAVVARMQRAESGVLILRTDASRDSARRTLLIILLSTVGAAIILGLAMRRIDGELRARLRSEEALRESEGRLQSFLDEAQDLIQITAPDGTFIYTNLAWRRAVGYGPAEVHELRFVDIVDDESLESVQHMGRLLREGVSVTNEEIVLRSKDGQRIVVAANANRHVDEDGTETHRGILRDITSQRELEAELRIQQAYLQQLFQSAPEAIVVLSADGHVLNANPEFTTTFGYEPGEVRGQRIEALIVPEGRSDESRRLIERLRMGERVRVDTVRCRKDGALINVSLLGAPIHVQGQPVALYAIYRDITERVRAEAALRQAKESAEAASHAKSQFLARMSHELRTPLNSVIGFANVLGRNAAGHLDDQELNYLERIGVNGEHLLGLINDILDLSKIEADRVDIDMRETSLGDLLRRVASQFEPQVAERSISLRIDAPDTLPPVLTDPDRLAQILINLVGNAVKFTSEGEVLVRVETDGDGRAAAITVQDTGIGIAPDRLDAIFDAFEQAEATTTRRFGGTGLGLAICKSLCERLGYDLEVHSELGVGSTFTVTLASSRAAAVGAAPDAEPEAGREPAGAPGPGRDGGAAPSAGPETAQPHTHGATPAAAGTPADRTVARAPTQATAGLAAGNGRRLVLVIDDDADFRMIVGEYLRNSGCRVEFAATGEEGLRLAGEMRPDLITLDLQLPALSGATVLKRLQANPATRLIPVVVLSILASESRGALEGAVQVLDKPIGRDELVAAVHRFLAGPRGRVMVVEDDPDARALIRRYLADEGVREITEAENGAEGLRDLRAHGADLLIADLAMPVMDGITMLQQVKRDPALGQIPVILVSARDLSHSEADQLQGLVVAALRKGPTLEADLKDALDRVLSTIRRA